MMPLVDPSEITIEQRMTVTRLVRRQQDADALLDMLFGEMTTTVPVAARPPLTSAEREHIRWMRSTGMTVQAIADDLGRARQTVSLIVREQEK